MAVAETLQLPNQPVIGSAERVTLGGNGFTAPLGMYVIRNWALVGDATGGELTFSMIMDPRYCSMIGYATFQKLVSAGRVDLHQRISSSAVAVMGNNVSLEPLQGLGGSPEVLYTWMPPAMVNPGSADEVPTLVCSILNVDTESASLQAVVFLFDIRAREVSSYADLIGARGGQYLSNQTT